MALNQSWAERCAEASGPPQPLRIQSANCSIGGNSPTEVMAVIENTPGSTWMNRPLGAVKRLPGAWSRTGQLENPYEWINSKDLGALGSFPYTPTGVDR